MAIENSLNVRIKPAIKSTSDVSVPLSGEMVLVRDTNNTDNNNIKIGDGSTGVSSLSNFITKSYVFIRYSNSSNPQQDTDVHTTPQSGDKYIAFYRSNTNTPPSRTALSGLWSKYIGDDGTSITVKPDRASCQNVGDAYIDQDTTSSTYGHLMILTDITTTPWTFADAGEIRGPAGDSAYVHIKYAASNTPTTSDMHSTWQSGDTYIGIYSDNNSTDSTNYTDYVWSYYIGPAGQSGQDGITPHIDETTKHWMIGSTDTGVIAEGQQGPQGTQGTQGTQGPQGEQGTPGSDGITPHIDSTTGNWFIGSTDTGVHAQGPQGDEGTLWKSGTSVTNVNSNIPSGMKIGDYYLNTNTYNIYKCISDTNPKWSLECNIKGLEGLGIYSSSVSSTSSSTVTIAVNTITIPTGRSLKVGDLILTADGNIFRISAIASNNCTVVFIESIGSAGSYSAGTGLSLNNNTFSLKTSTSSEIGGGKTSNSLYTAYGSTDYIDVDSEVSNAQPIIHTIGVYNNVIRIDLSNAIPSTNYFFTIPMSAFSTYSQDYGNYNIQITCLNADPAKDYGLIHASNSPITVEQILNCDIGLSSLGDNVFCVLRWYANTIQLLYIKYDNPRIGALTCIDDNDRYYSCLPNIGNGLKYEPTSNNYSRILLKTSSSTDIGGIKVANNSASSAGSVASSGTYYPIETTPTGEACVKIPGNSPATTLNNPGLLTVARNANSDFGYVNTANVIAVPIFYGSIQSVKEFEEESYNDIGECFTGHYVNIYDVINGLIEDSTLLGVLKQALDKIKN